MEILIIKMFYVRSLLRLASASTVIAYSTMATVKAIKTDFWLIFVEWFLRIFNLIDLWKVQKTFYCLFQDILGRVDGEARKFIMVRVVWTIMEIFQWTKKQKKPKKIVKLDESYFGLNDWNSALILLNSLFFCSIILQPNLYFL